MHRRRRVAILSPFPPLASGIANYSFRLVEELALLGGLDIDCFADGLDRSPGESRAPAGLPIYDARWFPRMEAATAGYDEVVYVLGNSEFHAAALSSLRRRSGIVLAHEVRLSGLYRFAADSRSAVPDGLAGSIRRVYGPLLPEGLASSGQVTAIEAERYGLLMAREVIGLAERFLVTSQAAARLARVEAGPELARRVGVVPFATEVPRTDGVPPPSPPGLEPGARVVATFGIVDPVEQPDRLFRAFAAAAETVPTSFSPSSALSASSWLATCGCSVRSSAWRKDSSSPDESSPSSISPGWNAWSSPFSFGRPSRVRRPPLSGTALPPACP